MTLDPTIVVYAPQHHLHAPATQFLNGELQPYYDRPERVDTIRQQLGGELYPVEEPLALAELEQTHDPAMLAYLRATCAEIESSDYFYPTVFAPRPLITMPPAPRRNHGFFAFDTDAPLGRHTWEAAALSANVAATAASLLLAARDRCVYALCRPPGHHAGDQFFGGYCYLNNAAIAARRLRAVGRVAIIDIDYHHGNGTQAIFWNDPEVLVGSIHADPAFEYPYYSGFAEETGGEQAPDTTVNLPLPSGTDGPGFLAALDQLLSRVVEFAPATVVVSAGYDTACDDPVGEFELLAADYTAIGARLARLRLPTLFVQEGGYYLPRLGLFAQQLLMGFRR